MAAYAIDAGRALRRYHPMEVPKGWRMLGTIHCENDTTMGVLGRSPTGLYALLNGESVRMLDQHAVNLAQRNIRPR